MQKVKGAVQGGVENVKQSIDTALESWGKYDSNGVSGGARGAAGGGGLAAARGAGAPGARPPARPPGRRAALP